MTKVSNTVAIEQNFEQRSERQSLIQDFKDIGMSESDANKATQRVLEYDDDFDQQHIY